MEVVKVFANKVSGATIQTAIDWYKPYVLEGKAWDYEDIHGNFRPKSIVHQLSIASSRLDVSDYMDFMHECGGQGIDFLYFRSRNGLSVEHRIFEEYCGALLGKGNCQS